MTLLNVAIKLSSQALLNQLNNQCLKNVLLNLMLNNTFSTNGFDYLFHFLGCLDRIHA